MKLKSLILALIACLGFFITEAQAYIPHSRTIVGRLAKNSGKGSYIVEQDVSFRINGETITIREKWVSSDSEALRLTATSSGGVAENNTRYDALYTQGKKVAPDLKGSIRTTGVPSEFIESFQHARSGSSFLNLIVKSGLVPASFVKDRPRFSEKMQYEPEPLVRLGRAMGVVNYVFGTPTSDAARPLPGVWIEQDAFFVRRLRFPTGAELTADRYVGAAGSLRFPTERVVTWGENSATIKLVSVKPLEAAKASASLAPQSLTANEARAARIPDVPAIKEFYSRFR